MLYRALKQTLYRDQKRGHAPYWNADNSTQAAMEVDAVREFTTELNGRGSEFNIRSIRKNSDPYPDCLVETSIGPIGVEVTEFVSEEAIRQYPRIPRVAGSQSAGLESSGPLVPIWNIDFFHRKLDRIVRKKDARVRDSSYIKQCLLIVTDEPWLDEETVSKYLKVPKLERPKNFDRTFLMLSYCPDPHGDGTYPVFELLFLD